MIEFLNCGDDHREFVGWHVSMLDPPLRPWARELQFRLVFQWVGTRHRDRMTRPCLYSNRLEDPDVKVLEALMAGSVAEVGRKYPHPRDA